MKYTEKIVFILLLIFVSLICRAQYFEKTLDAFQKLTVEDGLSQNTIACILRDHSGFVWFGTRNGLNRFDGKKITILAKDFGHGENLKDFNISSIIEDEDGILWIGSTKGIVKYNPVLESIERFRISGGSKVETSVLCIEPEIGNKLWLGTNDGLKLFDKKSGFILESYSNEPFQSNTISNNSVFAVCNCDSQLWIGNAEGLNIFNKQTRTFERCNYRIKNLFASGNNRVLKIIKDYRGYLWIGCDGGGLSSCNLKTGIFKTYNTSNSKIPNDDIRDIFDLRNGKLWLATNGGGVSLFNAIDQSFDNYRYNYQNSNGLSNNSIYSIIEDHEGILWIGSYANGVNFNSSQINNFKNVTHLPGNPNSLCENNARSLFMDSNNNLWIGTLGGLSKYDSKYKQYHNYVFSSNDPNSLSFNTITTVFEDDQRNVWVGTYSGGVNLLKRNKNSFIHFRYSSIDSSSLSSNNIFCITQDSMRNIWVATSAGLDLFDKKTNKWLRKGTMDIRDIYLASSGNLLLAITGGLAEYNPRSDSFAYYLFNDISYNAASVICEDSKGRVWLGTQGDGLGLFDINSKKFKIFKTSDGLPSNFISSIVNYNDKYLWISTYKGISLFDKEKFLFVNFGLADGIPFLEFFPQSSAVLPDQTIAFGGTNGIVYFDPVKIINEPKKSNIQLSALNIAGEKVVVGSANSPLTKNLNLTEVLNLNYDQKDFSIEFIDINFKNKGNDQYVFKLENYNNEWRNVENHNIIGFTNMSPGNYILRIKNFKDNTESENEARLNINIIPPIWMRWYFHSLLLIVFMYLFYLYRKYTLISINQKNEIRLKSLEYKKQEEFNKLRLRFFTYISHELRTPLTLIIDPVNKLIQMKNEKESHRYLKLIEKNSNRLLRLVDQILDFRKLENDALKLIVSKRNIGQIVTDIFNSFEETAKTEKISYVLDNKVLSSIEGWIDSDKLEKIMYNLLSNAFKFTKESGEVLVGLASIDNDRKIEIVIKDNGYGINSEQLQHIFDLFYSDEKQARYHRGSIGVGLSYVKQLVDLHHGTIEVESKQEEGTAFKVTLPINKISFTSDEISIFGQITEVPNDQTRINFDQYPIDWDLQKHGSEVPLILIVDDETDLRSYLAARLSCNFRILEAGNGNEALVLAENNTPDLILSDNLMPEMDGVELCNELKSRMNLDLIPFVFMSAWNSDDFKLQGLKSGADDYISKPFNFEILETKITNIINRRKKFVEIARKMVKVEPNDVKIRTIDEQFILRSQQIVERNIGNTDFSAKSFEDLLFMSHSVVYRKLKDLTGLGANEFIREYRLRRAAQILTQDKNINILEVCLMVGISDSRYFSQCFKKTFGISPSDYVRKNSHLD